MITDERTQNKLYADTETTLFRLENKPEAVSRIMEIIRDTPEYVQLMHSLPTYAEEDRQAAWWQGKESDSLLAELLHVLELYTGRIHTGTGERQNARLRVRRPGICKESDLQDRDRA